MKNFTHDELVAISVIVVILFFIIQSVSIILSAPYYFNYQNIFQGNGRSGEKANRPADYEGARLEGAFKGKHKSEQNQEKRCGNFHELLRPAFGERAQDYQGCSLPEALG